MFLFCVELKPNDRELRIFHITYNGVIVNE